MSREPAVISHLAVGPEDHGVVRHGLGLFRAAREAGVGGFVHRLVREVAELPAAEPPVTDPSGAELSGTEPSGTEPRARAVLHVSFTDALFGPDADSAVEAVLRLRLRGGRLLSVGPHDVPQPEEGAQRFARRRAAFARLVRGADLVIAHSEHEAAALRELAGQGPDGGARTAVRTVPLPLEDPLPLDEPQSLQRPVTADDPAVVGVLGFVHPGKGIEDVIDGVPPGTVVRAIGAAASGHDADARALRERAAARGVRFELTGYVPEPELAGQLAAVDVPVCPHLHVSASGSLNTWIAHGRRPLVVDGPYMREIDGRWPGAVLRRPREELAAAMDELLAEPQRTRAAGPPPRWGWTQVAQACAEAWTELLR